METSRTLVRRSPRTPTQRLGRRADEAPLLGRYRLLERLGAGGFGEVWRAHDEVLRREVAVKRIDLGAGGEPLGERAAREAHATARLSHPGIVALFEACAAGEDFLLISELVDGQTLAALIAADALSDAQALEIGVALADALLHAHARGVIHRDIKPQNVLVPRRPEGPSEAAKLTDFGGASLVGEDVLTRTGDVLGTLAYMAPEQSEGRETGEAADLYSLALVLYEALCGVNPVRGPTPAATARRIGSRIESLAHHRDDLPQHLTTALDRALTASPERRGSLRELRDTLREALEDQAPRYEEPHDNEGPHDTLREPGGRRRPIVARRVPLQAPAWEEASTHTPPRSYRPATVAADAARMSEPTAGHPDMLQAPGAVEEPHALAPRSLALPRAVWIGCALALVVWLAVSGRPGVALLALAAAIPMIALPRREGPGWLLAALAPLLGLVGLAGAYPALAGQASRWRLRAALGALGYWWLTLGEPLMSTHTGAGRLWLGAPAGVPARTAWEHSLGTAASHVLFPMLTLGVLLGAALWAAGALVLPLVVRGRSAAIDVVAATMWTAFLAAATPMLDSGLSKHPSSPRGLVLGAVLAGTIAVAARALRGPT